MEYNFSGQRPRRAAEEELGVRHLRVLTVLLTALLLVPWATGSAAETPPGTERFTLVQHGTPLGDVRRTYYLAVPPGRPAARPVVLVLHGRSQTPADAARFSGMTQLGRERGFLTVFPSSWAGVWDSGSCCRSKRYPDMPDVEFLDLVLADLAARTPVDRSRVYVTGFSNGGMMAYRFACERPELVAGIGVVSGSMSADEEFGDPQMRTCRPDKPVSVISVHGSGDTTVPYAGGAVASSNSQVAPVRAGIDQFAVAGGCRRHSTRKLRAGRLLDYTDCDGSAARLVKIEGLGHGWSRDTRRFGYDTSLGLWSFLSKYRQAEAR